MAPGSQPSINWCPRIRLRWATSKLNLLPLTLWLAAAALIPRTWTRLWCNAQTAFMPVCGRRLSDIRPFCGSWPRCPCFAGTVGPCAVCVLHGDSESLAGWKFAAPALREPQREAWLLRQFQLARADVFASSHTCLPALKTLRHAGRKYCVINNGAAGMPNFTHCLHGVLSRISEKPSPIRPLYGIQQNGVYIDALPVVYDQERWKAIFLSNWPEGTAAHLSYFQRISTGVPYTLREALITG